MQMNTNFGGLTSNGNECTCSVECQILQCSVRAMEDFIQSINVKIKLFILNQGYSQTNWQLFTKGYGSVFVFSFVIKPSPLQLEVPLEPASTLLVVLACTGCKPECSHGPRLPGGCLFNLYSYPQEQRACVVSLILCIACTDLIYK